MTFLLSIPSSAMDLQPKEMTEYSSLIAWQKEFPLKADFNFDLSYFSLSNQDIWLKIASKCYRIKDLLNLSSSSKGLHGIIFKDDMLKAQIEIFRINYKFQKFNNIYSNVISGKSKEFIFPEKEEQDIRAMAALKRKQEKLLSTINEQKNDVINLYEASYFEYLYETTHTTDEIIKDMLPLLLEHSADQNPSLWSLCPSSKMSEDLTYLASEVQYNLVTRLLNLKRGIKIISKNIPIIIGGTVLLVGAFSFGAYVLHQQYPAWVFDNFMEKNTTYYKRDPNNSNRYFMEEFFSVRCPPFSSYENFGENNTYFDSCVGRGKMIKGNMTDWIRFMHSRSRCSVERLSQQLMAVMNTTKSMVGPMICSPRDNSTICCLRAHQWNSGDSYDVAILIGDAHKAQDAAIHNWRIDIGLYYGFVGPLSLTFIWMLLLSHFCL